MTIRRDGYLFALPILISVLLTGCEIPTGGGENPPVYQTQILDIRVEPNPVAVGDTTTFTCITRDSLDQRFRFIWFIDGQPPMQTEENTLRWAADLQPGNHVFSVRADNGEMEEVAPSEEFHVRVIENLTKL